MTGIWKVVPLKMIDFFLEARPSCTTSSLVGKVEIKLKKETYYKAVLK